MGTLRFAAPRYEPYRTAMVPSDRPAIPDDPPEPRAINARAPRRRGAMARPTPALVGQRPVRLRHDPPAEPRARPRVARRDGSRTALVPGALAKPALRRRALRRPCRPHRHGALVNLPAAHLADALLGSRPALARADHSPAPRRPRRGHAHGQSAVWPGRSLLARGAQPLAAPARARPAPERRPARGMDARLHRHPLLAAPSALVPSGAGLPVRGRRPVARAGP